MRLARPPTTPAPLRRITPTCPCAILVKNSSKVMPSCVTLLLGAGRGIGVLVAVGRIAGVAVASCACEGTNDSSRLAMSSGIDKINKIRRTVNLPQNLNVFVGANLCVRPTQAQQYTSSHDCLLYSVG